MHHIYKTAAGRIRLKPCLPGMLTLCFKVDLEKPPLLTSSVPQKKVWRVLPLESKKIYKVVQTILELGQCQCESMLTYLISRRSEGDLALTDPGELPRRRATIARRSDQCDIQDNRGCGTPGTPPLSCSQA